MPDETSEEYIGSLKYDDWSLKIKDIVSTAHELQDKCFAARRLRWGEVDIEGQKAASRIAPDEIYIPLHLIDANIRREQPYYVQYVTQSNRAAILKCADNVLQDSSAIEHDLTERLRYEGWQQPLYATIDGFQQDGYRFVEVVHDQSKSGEVAIETMAYGDFGFINDTRDIQECEIVCRKYYYTKTKMKNLAALGQFDPVQVDRVVDGDRVENGSTSGDMVEKKDKSLYMIYKIMFRNKGVVHVAWASDERGDDWLRAPRPLSIGRKKVTGPPTVVGGPPASEDVYETNYPYVLYPYMISENDTTSRLPGRVILDQDVQEGASSLLSSYVTAHRRGAGLYFSKDVDDPNDDIELQKNVFFRTGALINSKIKQFQLNPPDASMMTAIQSLITENMAEMSQVNFAANNRKDSRKTATEISAASQSASTLTTVQVVLFSTALRKTYQLMFDVIKSRVTAGLIKVSPELAQLYAMNWVVKPAGDVDVIERQQLVSQMMAAWPVIQGTPANMAFLCDALEKMFPETAQKYVQILLQAQAQQQQAQQSQQAQLQQAAIQMAQKIVGLSQHPEMFSDVGKQNALPQIQQAASQIEQLQQQMSQQSQSQGKKQQ